MSDIRYPAVGEIWTYYFGNTEHSCFYSDDIGYGFDNNESGRYFLNKSDWEAQYRKNSWRSPKRVSDVLCFYVTPAKTIKATFYGDGNAMGKPYFLELFDDGSLNVREAS